HLEFTDSQMHRKFRSVASAPGHFAPDADALARTRPAIVGDIAVMGRMVWLRHEEMHIPPDEVRLVIAKQTRRSGIDRRDQAVAIDRDYRVERGFQNGRELLRLAKEGGGILTKIGHER